MKTQFCLLLMTICMLCSCNKKEDEMIIGGPVRTENNYLDLQFTDENGNDLSIFFPISVSGHSKNQYEFDKNKYKLRATIQGDSVPIKMVYAYGKSGKEPMTVHLDHDTVLVGDIGTYDFVYLFSCPSIFGDDEEHKFTFTKSIFELGLNSMAEVSYDGKVIATNVHDRKKPFKIVIHRSTECLRKKSAE